MRQKIPWIFLSSIAAAMGIYLLLISGEHVKAPAPADAKMNADVSQVTHTPPVKEVATSQLKQYIDTPGNQYWIINKSRPVESGYIPSDLTVPNVPLRLDGSAEQMHVTKLTAQALERMVNDAANAGYRLRLASGYRSYAYQKQLYESYVKKDGAIVADSLSARPGYSEHHTGFAVDISTPSATCELNVCFGSLPEGKWLAENAHLYGFVIRYPKDKQDITGYTYEPWHLRFIGVYEATETYAKNLTLEEYFGLPSATNY